MTGGSDDVARIWDAASGELLGPPLPHFAWLDAASFSPDGKLLATASTGRGIRVWDLPGEERPVADLVLLAQVLSSRRIDEKGALVHLAREELLAAWRTLRATYPADFACRPGPALLSPAPGATLPNGDLDADKAEAWTLRWATVPGATSYRLRVLQGGNLRQVVNLPTIAPEFPIPRIEQIPSALCPGWRWSVQARIDGVWSEWSEERTFDVAPVPATPPRGPAVPPSQ
jgi:hypothetical protein